MNKIIAIGALGGSGTRAVAQILIDVGVYLGDDLNVSNDNLLFTRLFKDPKWYKNASINDVRIRLEIFRKYMENEALKSNERRKLFRAAKENPTYKFQKSSLNSQKINPGGDDHPGFSSKKKTFLLVGSR